MQTCQSCKNFLTQNEAQGLCRRFPPAPIPTEAGVVAFFPPMLNEGWCGEHNEKETEQ